MADAAERTGGGASSSLADPGGGDGARAPCLCRRPARSGRASPVACRLAGPRRRRGCGEAGRKPCQQRGTCAALRTPRNRRAGFDRHWLAGGRRAARTRRTHRSAANEFDRIRPDAAELCRSRGTVRQTARSGDRLAFTRACASDRFRARAHRISARRRSPEQSRQPHQPAARRMDRRALAGSEADETPAVLEPLDETTAEEDGT